MDSAESYIGTISGDDIERRAKQSERVPLRGNSDTFSNKQKRLKMRKMPVKRTFSLIKIIFTGPFK